MKAWKLQESVAHSPGAVTCVTLGRKSGRVMATGGEDRKVKLWAVGKPTCILSLTGHTSSVESTEFSQEEDRVAAGSLSGSIRIWDLEEMKIVRTLSGHTSGISSLDFHPFGNFVASGSIDTLVKLWDVSRKGCINTYRGHAGGVNMVRFSPDGKWVVSSGEDGVVKLWDLSAGRQLAELTGHTGPVTAVAFHPTVLLLATASTDRTVRLFDLENFSQVAVSGTELAASAIRRIAFHPDGVCLYVATSDYLKLLPNGERPYTRCGFSNGMSQPRNRKSFCLVAEENSHSTLQEDSTDPDSQLSYKPSPDDQMEMANSADITDPEEYDRIFKPNRSVPRSPTRLSPIASSSTPFSAPPTSPSKECQSNQTTHKPVEDRSDRSLTSDRQKVTVLQPKQMRDDDKPFVPPSTARRTPSAATARTKRAVPMSSTEVNDIFSGFVKDVDTSGLVDRPEVFRSVVEPSESEWLSAVRKPHTPFMAVMSSRVENLSTVRVLWTRDNIRTAVETTLMLNEPAVLVDILSVLSQNSKLWSLDLVNTLLPHLLPLIQSKYSKHVETTCQAVHVILKNFAQLIRQTLDGPSPPGVDLVREERRKKCQECMRHLLSIRSALDATEVASRAGQCGRELIVRFQILS
ncbi:Katanin p80 WD40 repeat-containing subunit B1 [Paragonimus heterotremus]|uniref:Katanin p80 WD40 repeat-containing subunit B1 n=1 Tax=Paragonimus heterotremus TaxID=100268 RepID=A0A8J4WHZ7_9TREM|nr:Katanin p80 WD40 repeat-containing subunit B1 [Paragonimus heterotremus]